MTTRARKTTIAHMQRLVASAALVTNVACDHACGGYAVVDPMPTPARVPGVAASIVATVVFSEAGTTIILELKDPTFPGVTLAAKTTSDASGYSVSGGRVVDARATADGMRFELDPSSGRGALYMELEVAGTDAGGMVEATVTWGSAADGGRSLSVSLSDR
jgi:hypothetical protein